jgi:hypothetical protein
MTSTYINDAWRKLIILCVLLGYGHAVSAQLIPKRNDNPLKNQTDSIINNLTFGTMELNTNSPSANSTKSGDFTSKPGIMILNNGAKLAGYITPNEYGYRINYNNGSQIIPFEYIHCVGSSLEEVYGKLKEEHPEPTLADHIRLAKLCKQWEYKAGAVEQIKLAIMKDENHPEIKQLADYYFPKKSTQNIEQVSYSKAGSSTTSSLISKYKEFNDLNDTGVNKLPPLPSLNHDQSRKFSGVIQPILQARCGNARCHGGMSPQEFHVDWISRDQPMSRKRIEDTLRSFLAQIDRENPSQSPIITRTKSEDGAHGSSLWKDSLSQKNQATLFEFVYSLERSQQDVMKTDSSQATILKKIPQEEIPQLKPVPASGSQLLKDEKLLQASGTSMIDSTTNESWERFQKARSFDAFDPAVFNEK